MMNKGQTTGIAVMVAIIFFVSGMLLINLFKTEIDTARSGLSCSSPTTISDGTKLTCLLVDLVLPYFILVVLSASLGLVIGRFLG